MADYEDEIRNIVEEPDDTVSAGVMDDATASRLNELADDLEKLAKKSADSRLKEGVISLAKAIAVATALYIVKEAIDAFLRGGFV